MGEFFFDINDKVEIKVSGEPGIITAKVKYDRGDTQYLVRYKDNSGCAQERWWHEDALKAC